MPEIELFGCDFTSRPGKHKPIMLARGVSDGAVVRLRELLRFDALESFGHWLSRPGDWVGAFDLPFGLPRELVLAMGWPLAWEPCMRHYASLSRQHIRDRFAAVCAARPVGGKFAHRLTDRPAGSSPSMKWVNPPVAYMMHAGVPLLLDAGVCLPGLHPANLADHSPGGAARRIAVEAYPGLLAREILGRQSYKSDDRARQDQSRLDARRHLLGALEHGQTRLALRLELGSAMGQSLLRDASGDSIDAVLCLLQAAWALRCGWPRYGLPADMDPLEGWIVTAPADR